MNNNLSSNCPRCEKALLDGSGGGVCPSCAAAFLQGTQTDVSGDAKAGFTPPSVGELAPLFPQLELLAFLGRGGMGAVYKARQKELDRVVALKILPPGIGGEATFAERFAREAKALARLNHPGIVTIYDFGRVNGEGIGHAATAQAPPAGVLGADEGRMPGGTTGSTARAPLYFFLMEFVDGVTLRQLLESGRVSPREVLAIVPQICDALQFAHDQGIVHGDIQRVCMRVAAGRKNGVNAVLAGQTPANFLPSAA